MNPGRWWWRPGARWRCPREDVADLAGAAVWGWCGRRRPSIRRIVLVDSDAATDDAAIAMALATGEPQ
ncbi:hypothetical protein ABLN97_14010 [Mycobacterium tuberculosis]